MNNSGKGYFIVNLKSTTIYQRLKMNPNYQNPYCSMEVFRDGESGELVYIGSDFGKKDRLYVKCDDLIKGKYYVSVSFSEKDDEKEFTVSNEVEPFNKNFNYRVGLYSSLNNNEAVFGKLNSKDKNEKNNYILDLIKQEAESKEEKLDFAVEGEPDSWRVISLDNDKKGYGYIQYRNNSDAFLKEKLKFLKLKNISIIPFIEEGYFIQEEQVNKNKKRENKSSISPKKGHHEKDKKNEEVEYESDTLISVVDNLKGQKLESSYTIVEDEEKLPEEK